MGGSAAVPSTKFTRRAAGAAPFSASGKLSQPKGFSAKFRPIQSEFESSERKTLVKLSASRLASTPEGETDSSSGKKFDWATLRATKLARAKPRGQAAPMTGQKGTSEGPRSEVRRIRSGSAMKAGITRTGARGRSRASAEAGPTTLTPRKGVRQGALREGFEPYCPAVYWPGCRNQKCLTICQMDKPHGGAAVPQRATPLLLRSSAMMCA